MFSFFHYCYNSVHVTSLPESYDPLHMALNELPRLHSLRAFDEINAGLVYQVFSAVHYEQRGKSRGPATTIVLPWYSTRYLSNYEIIHLFPFRGMSAHPSESASVGDELDKPSNQMQHSRATFSHPSFLLTDWRNAMSIICPWLCLYEPM